MTSNVLTPMFWWKNYYIQFSYIKVCNTPILPWSKSQNQSCKTSFIWHRMFNFLCCVNIGTHGPLVPSLFTYHRLFTICIFSTCDTCQLTMKFILLILLHLTLSVVGHFRNIQDVHKEFILNIYFPSRKHDLNHKRTAYTAFWTKAPPGRKKNIPKGTVSNG